MILKKASVSDCEQLWRMQKESFSGLLEKYRDYDTSPANEPVDKVRKRLEQSFTYYYYINADGENVGAIRIVDMKDDNTPKRISPVFIMPQHRRKGYAKQAILEAEKLHGSDNWELETILQEEGNCRLYESLGYKKTGRTEDINTQMTLVYYRK